MHLFAAPSWNAGGLARRLVGASALCWSACSAPPPPPPHAVAIAVVAPPPLPACGSVDVDDHTPHPSPGGTAVVRDTMRQRLAALGACARPYRLHVDVTLEPGGLGRVRARFFLVVYRVGGALAGEIPTTLTGDRSSDEDIVATNALLRIGSEHAAQVFTEHFR